MANEYAVNQHDLKTVADAIRAKAGVSDTLVFPSGFADAVAAIAAGSGMDMDVGEIVLEASNLDLTIPTTKKQKYVVVFLDGNPLALGLTAYQIYAGVAYAGADGVAGYGGNLWVNYTGTIINTGGAHEEGYTNGDANPQKGPVFNDNNIQMARKLSGTNSNAWAAGVTYKYFAWG